MSNQSELIRLVRKGRRSEQRGKAVQGCLTALLADMLHALLNGWMLMLAIGIAHTHWHPAVPTIGYWWAVLIVYLLRGAFSAAHPSTNKEMP